MNPRLIRFRTVSRNEWFHEVPVEIFQRIERRRSQAAGAWSQFRSDKSQPDVVNHPHSGAQLCGRAAWMFVEVVLNILFYDNRKLFDCNGDHS